MSLHKTFSALVKRFIDEEVFPVNRVQWPNRVFNPPSGESWVSISFMPATAEPISLSLYGYDRLTGFLIINFYSPVDVGDGAIYQFYDKVRGHFIAGDILDFDGQKVVIEKVAMNPTGKENSFVKAAILITWRSDVIRRNPLPTELPELEEGQAFVVNQQGAYLLNNNNKFVITNVT